MIDAFKSWGLPVNPLTRTCATTRKRSSRFYRKIEETRARARL